MEELVGRAKEEGVTNTDYMTEPEAVLTKRDELLKEQALGERGEQEEIDKMAAQYLEDDAIFAMALDCPPNFKRYEFQSEDFKKNTEG